VDHGRCRAAAGAGLPVLASVTTVIYFVVTVGFPLLSRRLPSSSTAVSVLRVRYPDGRGILRQVLRVIPGSHRLSEPPIDMQAFGSGMGPYPEDVKITAPAGSVILFNSADLWHSGTVNHSLGPRLAVTAGFGPGRC
jgi:hypothetical protein